MSSVLSWLDLVFETPAIEDANGNVMPRRGTVQYTGLAVSDDEDNDRTVIAPPPTVQQPGVLPLTVMAGPNPMNAVQASYQGLRLTGTPTGAFTVSYPSPPTDANGASGGVYAINNTTTQTATIGVTSGTGTVIIPPKSGAAMLIDVNGAFLSTTTAGP